MIKRQRIDYFLGANSGQGFSSLYDSFVSHEQGDFLWVIKGGAGCGKSSFMKMIGGAAERAGLEVEYVRCSGDPNSLDGVYIPSLKTAFMDGTAPHVADANLTAVDSAYIDLSQFYDVNAIANYKDELNALNFQCKLYYKKAYALLSAAASLKSGWLDTLALPQEKSNVKKRMERLCLREFGARRREPGTVTKRFLSAYTCLGRMGFPETAEFYCNRLYALESRCALDSLALNYIAQSALDAGYDILLCPDPLLPEKTEAVIIPALALGFVSADCPLGRNGEYKHIRLDSAIEKSREKELRPQQRRYEKSFSFLIEEATSALSDAKRVHDRLEQIYNPLVDFGGVYELVSEYLSRLGLSNI